MGESEFPLLSMKILLHDWCSSQVAVGKEQIYPDNYIYLANIN